MMAFAVLRHSTFVHQEWVWCASNQVSGTVPLAWRKRFRHGSPGGSQVQQNLNIFEATKRCFPKGFCLLLWEIVRESNSMHSRLRDYVPAAHAGLDLQREALGIQSCQRNRCSLRPASGSFRLKLQACAWGCRSCASQVLAASMSSCPEPCNRPVLPTHRLDLCSPPVLASAQGQAFGCWSRLALLLCILRYQIRWNVSSNT